MLGKKKEFALELIKFYKNFLLGSADAVDILAKIEKKYQKEYKIIKELKDDPNVIAELTKEMTEEEKDTFLLIIVESSSLGQRINRLFDLTQKEKEKLADDLETFAKKVDTKLRRLV